MEKRFHSTAKMMTTKIEMKVYSLLKKTIAPEWTASAIVFIISVPLGYLLTRK
jgi:putative flippase GtrA